MASRVLNAHPADFHAFFTPAGHPWRGGQRYSARRGESPLRATRRPRHQHLPAVLLVQPDGGWALVDPGSTNGTWLNDAADRIVTNTAVPLRQGDRIHLGAWTTIIFGIADDVPQ
jgi:hypothetical protein